MLHREFFSNVLEIKCFYVSSIHVSSIILYIPIYLLIFSENIFKNMLFSPFHYKLSPFQIKRTLWLSPNLVWPPSVYICSFVLSVTHELCEGKHTVFIYVKKSNDNYNTQLIFEDVRTIFYHIFRSMKYLVNNGHRAKMKRS